MTPVRVILADDHPVVRAGIRNLLSRSKSIEVVAETGNGAEVLRLVNDLNPDVLLLDMEMPGLDGVDVARRLRASNSQVRILALSGYDDKQYIMELLQEGIAGYMLKDEAPESLVDVVLSIAQGQQGWFSKRVREQIPGWIDEARQGNNSQLTEREVELLRLLAERKSDAWIGLTLGMSEAGVKSTIQSVLAKMGAATREEAVDKARSQGILS